MPIRLVGPAAYRSMPAILTGGGTGDRLSVGQPANSINMTNFSAAVLIRVDTLTSGRVLFSKVAGSAGWDLALSGTTGDLVFDWGRATTALAYTTNTTPIVPGQWQWVCVTARQGASANALIQIYTRLAIGGPLLTAGFATTQDGSGAYTSDSGNNMAFANTSNGSLAIQGAIAMGFLRLHGVAGGSGGSPWTYAEWLSFTDHPFNYISLANGFWRFGELGRGSTVNCADESGKAAPGTAGQASKSVVGPPLKGTAPVWLSALAAAAGSVFGAGYYMRRRAA